MATINNLPIYNFIINDEDDGVYAISFVKDPATEVMWQAFDTKKPIKSFAIANEEQHIVLAPVMIANTPIYRNDAEMGEYYCIFDCTTIKKMQEKFFKDGNIYNVDINHDSKYVDGCHIISSYIIDKENGINPKGFENVPDGSWMAEYKINNEDIWAKVKSGEIKSFSLEGYFSTKPYSKKEEIVNDEYESLEYIYNILNSIYNNKKN